MAHSRENKTNKAGGSLKQPSEVAKSTIDQPSLLTESQLPKVSAAEPSRWSRQTLFQGWISIAAWMTFGLLLEGLLGYKTPAYLLDSERRELFLLAHTHGTLLGLLLLAAALCGQHFSLSPPPAAVMTLRIGALLMPLGFLLAGIWHYESDPGVAIWLVPPAALLIIFGVVAFALSSLASLRGKD